MQLYNLDLGLRVSENCVGWYKGWGYRLLGFKAF